MNPNIFKLCTAAFAGSLLGVAYERYQPSFVDLPNFGKIVSADANLKPFETATRGVEFQEPYKPVTSTNQASVENFKHSARFGLPSKDNLRLFNDFFLSYDRRLRSPNWVFEHLTPDKLNHKDGVHRGKSKFMEDDTLHPYFRSTPQDYHNSGYDRGHMAPAGDFKLSQDSLDQTFTLSNISPQEADLNRGGWERLETYVRWRAKRSRNLYVITGPLFLPMRARDGNLYVTYRVLGDNHVSVPTHYFKVMLVETHEGDLLVESFLMPNQKGMDNVKLDDYRVPMSKLDSIERASGVIFFDQLDRSRMKDVRSLPTDFKDQPYKDRPKKLAKS